MGGDDAIVIFEINRSGVFERGTQHIQIEIYRNFNTLVGLKPLEFEKYLWFVSSQGASHDAGTDVREVSESLRSGSNSGVIAA